MASFRLQKKNGETSEIIKSRRLHSNHYVVKTIVNSVSVMKLQPLKLNLVLTDIVCSWAGVKEKHSQTPRSLIKLVVCLSSEDGKKMMGYRIAAER